MGGRQPSAVLPCMHRAAASRVHLEGHPVSLVELSARCMQLYRQTSFVWRCSLCLSLFDVLSNEPCCSQIVFPTSTILGWTGQILQAARGLWSGEPLTYPAQIYLQCATHSTFRESNSLFLDHGRANLESLFRSSKRIHLDHVTDLYPSMLEER